MTLAPGTFAMLVDAAWRVTLILSAAWLLATALRRQAAAVRHAVWALALLAALAIPAVGGLVPEWRLPILPPETVIAGPANATAPSGPLAQAPSLDERARPGSDTAVAPSARMQTDESAANVSTDIARQAIDWLGLIWVTVAAMVLGRYVASVASVRWVLRDAEPVDDPRWRDATDIAAAELGLRETPRVLASQSVTVPFTAGLFRPVVVVPALAVHHWSDERLRVVLLHELAHVSRRDCLMQALTQIACAAYWFNPLTWVAARRLRSERERACDDLVLAAGLRGSEYAQHLLDIARTANSRRALSAAALAMARPSELEGRLLAILDSRRAGSLSATGTSWRGIALAALGVVVLASVQPVAREMAQAAIDTGGNDAVMAAGVAPATREAVAEQPASTPSPTPAPTPAPTPSPALARDVGALVHSLANEVASHAPAVASTVAVSVAEGVVEGIHEAIQELAHAPQAATAESPRRAVSPAVLKGLTEAMKDPDPDVRKQALQGLTRLGAPIAFETLVEALKDPDSDIREQAAFALGRMKDVRAVAPLTSALSDEQADVREQAVFALSQMRATEALPGLRKALSDPSPDVREQALMALWQLRDPSSVPAFMQALKDESEDVREQAVFALSQMGDKSAVPALLTVLAHDESEDVREQAAFAISQIGDESAVDALTAALKDKSPDVRRQAVFALSQIGSGDSTPRPAKRPKAVAPVVAPSPAAAPTPVPQ